MYPIANRKELIKENNLFWIDSQLAFKQYFITKHPYLTQNLINDKYYDIAIMLSFGLFKVAPKLYRYKIYNNGQWLVNYDNDSNTIINNISTLYAATHTGNTNSTKPTFKFFHTMMTHSPFGIHYNNGQCDYLSDETIWDDTKHYMALTGGRYPPYQHFDTEICALKYIVHYIKWLKEKRIYNNTQIFIVSDHAGFDSLYMPPLTPRIIGADTLFLFKDFGASGTLRTDNRLMANYDIASIFCANLTHGCPRVGKNILSYYPQNREIIHARPNDDFNRHKPNLWLIDKAYKISGNIYRAENWVDISDESYGIVNVE